MKIEISEISDKMLDHYIKRCHRILKDGSCREGMTYYTELKFKKAEKALPLLRQELDRRDAKQAKNMMYHLIHKPFDLDNL